MAGTHQEGDSQFQQRALDLFDHVVSLGADEQRVFMAGLATSEPAIATQLECLLEADRDTDSLLDAGALERSLGLLQYWSEERRVGPWRLLQPLGRGGMGIVYLAERADGEYRQQVALKLIPRALDSDAMRRRFLAERQILARLEHPRIARLVDGGVNEEGHPYLAMELVDGTPIIRFVEERHLALEARLGLFLEICEAVDFAHRSLVVHRDLKPDNILVTESGVKLLDFGIAKTLEEDEAHTRTELRRLTPEYASPEQVRGLAVTTQSDVYSLGLILYELLCGRRAHVFDAKSAAEIERGICESEPTRPSRVLEEQAKEGGKAWRWRRRSRRRLDGDLDAMVLTALRKDVSHRYPSVAALAAEIEAFLDRRPVTARAPSATYRVGKFVQRNRLAVVSFSAVALSLLAGLSVAVWQARIARVEGERARIEAETSAEVATFLANLFNSSNPLDPSPVAVDELSARDLLDRGAARLETELHEQPAVRAELLGVVGEVYKNVSLLEDADRLIQLALDSKRELHPSDHPTIGDSYSHLGQLRQEQGRYAEAEELHRQALEVRRSHALPPNKDIAESEYLLGLALSWQEKSFDEAERLLLSALEQRRTLFGVRSAEVAYVANTLGGMLSDLGRTDEAEAHLLTTLEVRRELLGDRHPSTAVSLNNLANAYRDGGKFAEAEPLFREATAILREQLGAHVYVAIGLNNIADVLESQGKTEEAERLFRQGLEVFQELGLTAHALEAVIRSRWGAALLALGRTAEARAPLEDGYLRILTAFGEEHPHTKRALERLEKLSDSGHGTGSSS